MRIKLGAAFTVIAALSASLLVACTPTEAPTFTGLQVTVPSGAQPSMTAVELSGAALSQVQELELAGGGIVVGTPMEISLADDQSATGAVLERTYATALPSDIAASFVYWDEEYDVWVAVPTTLSDDRRTVSAVVDHFSIWTDILAGTAAAVNTVVDGARSAGQQVTAWAGGALATASEALHWSVGNIFSTRVEVPECDLSTPRWVQTLPVDNGVDLPVRFCAGHDAANPDLLVVKARSNRGYGFPVTLSVAPTWEYNSTAENTLASSIATIGNVDAAVGESIAQLFAGGRFLGAGDEISFGLSETAVRGSTAQFLIELPAPSLGQYVASAIAQQLTAWGVSRVEGLLAATIAIAKCTAAVTGVTDIGKFAGATLTCLSSARGDIARAIEAVLRSRGTQQAAAQTAAGTIVGRVSLALAVIPIAASVLDWIAEGAFPTNVRALTVTLVPQRTTVPTRWLIDAGGVGPLRLGASVPDAATLEEIIGSDRGLCSPTNTSGWGIDGNGESILVIGNASPDAPATVSGITLGSSVAELEAVGATGVPWKEEGYFVYTWQDAGTLLSAWVDSDNRVIGIGVGTDMFYYDYC